eukprot:gene9382-10188_t
MGGGLTKADLIAKEDYVCVPIGERTAADEGCSSPPPEMAGKTELIELKKNLLQKMSSHPDLLTKNTIFTPYIDVRVKSRDAGVQYIQRSVGQSKCSMVGDGKLNYKKYEYYECSISFPWLLKNAYFIRPCLKDFDLRRPIGVGRSSTVMLAETMNGKFCAIKTIKKDYVFKNHETRHVLSERDALYHLNSCFCMKLFTEFEDSNNAYFVIEYVPGGELKRYLRHQGMLGPETTRFYMSEVLLALEHIHSKGYVYRHLCPENIAIDEEGHIKLIDFGSTIRHDYNLNGKLYTICCSAGYLSPEQLNSKFDGGYGKEVDSWQFGIVLYELMTGDTPFIQSEKDSKYEILMRILRHKLKFPKHFDPAAKDLVSKILNPEIDQRLSSETDIRNHEFFLPIKNWKDVLERRLQPPHIPNLNCYGDSSNFHLTKGSAKHWKLGVLENQTKFF